MPQGGSFHIDRALSNVATKYRNAEFIADKVFNSVKVEKQSDLYYVYQRDFRLADTYRADGSPSNRESWGITTQSYSATEHALNDVVTDRQMMNADTPLNLKMDTVEFLTDKIMMKRELDLANLLFTTTAATSNVTLNTATSFAYNTTTSDPIGIINSASSVVVNNCGKYPNCMVMGNIVFTRLRNNQNVHERIKYVERSIMSEPLIAAVLDLENVYVGWSIYDAAEESHPTAVESITSIWGNSAYLYYKNPSVNRKALTAGLTLEQRPFQVKTWRDEAVSGEVIEVSNIYTHRLVATSAAFYFITPALV